MTKSLLQNFQLVPVIIITCSLCREAIALYFCVLSFLDGLSLIYDNSVELHSAIFIYIKSNNIIQR